MLCTLHPNKRRGPSKRRYDRSFKIYKLRGPNKHRGLQILINFTNLAKIKTLEIDFLQFSNQKLNKRRGPTFLPE